MVLEICRRGFVLWTCSKRGYLLRQYEQFTRLIPDHTDFPDYYEWLYRTNEQETHMIKQGFVVTKVTVDPDEFTQYCHSRGARSTASDFT